MGRSSPAPLALALALVVAGCAASPRPPLAAPLDGLPLARFDRVSEGIYRSAQPDGEQLRHLVARYGLRTIVKLNSGSDEAPAGVAVIHERLSVMSEPSPETIARVLDRIDAAPRPLLIHCTHGEDRTGLIVALHRLRHGATVAEAFLDMLRHGFHAYPGVWRAWRRAVGWDERR